MEASVAFSLGDHSVVVEISPTFDEMTGGLLFALGWPSLIALFRGTSTARLLIDRKVADTVRWNVMPRRRLAGRLGEALIEVELGKISHRRAKLFVDGKFLEEKGF